MVALRGGIDATLVARRATDGEHFETAEGRALRLEPEDLVLAVGETVVALAGIADAAATPGPDVLFVAGSFDPEAVARTSDRLRSRTALSMCASRGTDPRQTHVALFDALQLARDALGASCTGWTDEHEPIREPRRLAFRAARTRAIAGIAISEDEGTKSW